MILTRYRILVSYRGDGFFGWQKQKSHPSVQGAIETALKEIAGKEIRVYGSARTDTGVHALAQNAHFDLPQIKFPLKQALNAKLPPDIYVKKIWQVPLDFHCLHHALSKSYIYLIKLSRDVFFNSLVFHWPHKTDLSLLRTLAKTLSGRKDFKSFQNTGSAVSHTVRTIHSASWFAVQPDFLVFHINGDGFLKQMVRNLVGTQLELLNKKEPLKKLQAILEAKDRKAGLKTAPPQGLYLYKVHYPKNILLHHREL